MDKNILRGCLEDLTYMCCPGDDLNKDRVTSMLEPSDDEDDGMRKRTLLRCPLERCAP